MISLDWLTERLCEVLRWQLAHPDATDGPPVPWAGQRVWSIFLTLNMVRTGNGFGPNPISNLEIESYARIHREPIRPFEVDMLRALDAAYLKAASQVQRGEQDPPSSEAIMGAIRRAAGDNNVSKRPMSTKLFDAIFPG